MTSAPAAPANLTPPGPGNAGSTELWVSWLLRGGVLLSLALTLLGTAVSFAHHPEFFVAHGSLTQVTHPGSGAPHNLTEILASARTGQGQGIVALGLLVLIATPILRVVLSMLLFWRQGDRLYTAITLTVLALLAVSMVVS